MPPPHPNSYTLPPTQHIPSSPLPLLHYASALPSPVTKPTARAFLEANSWLQGGVFKHYPTPHFHSNTHECYAVVAGESTFLLGKGPIDEDVDVEEDREGEREGQSEKKGNWPGVTISVKTGDVVVNPAGVAHSCLESSPDFEYIGVYPEGSPHWDNNWCKAGAEETAQKAATARAVPIPATDPVFGLDGPLVRLWREAAGLAESTDSSADAGVVPPVDMPGSLTQSLRGLVQAGSA
ncbi:hypothetical protein M8818_007553 [Zalaria obscura]|uniref:Uncharacterized protein n=1 Tax=Zalaria obscura TaxID=2024903 RepID=A0ACC3S7Q5_9PEZI